MKYRVPLGLVAALAVAFVLGLPHLSSEPLWFDEVLSLSIYRPPARLAEMTAYLAANENHPPLYYFLMLGWTRWFGERPAAIRFPSVLLTVLAVGLLYGLARQWFGRRVATLAALLYALSPLAVEFSREARPYALIAALAVSSWWALSRWLDGGPRRLLVAYAAFTIGGLYTHAAYLFLLAAQWLAAAFALGRAHSDRAGGRTSRRDFLVAGGAVLAGYAPWIPVLVENLAAQYFYPEGLTPISQLTFPSDFILLDFVFNALFFPAKWPVDALGRVFQALGVGALAAGVALAGRAAWRAQRPPTAAGEPSVGSPAAGGRLTVLLLWIFVPPVLYLFSPMAGRYSWYYHRHLIAGLPAVAMLAAVGFDRLARNIRPLVSPLAVGLGLAAYALMNAPQYLVDDSRWDPQHQFAGAVRFIAGQGRAGRELVTSSWYGYRLLLDYYSRGSLTVGSFVPERRYSNQLTLVAGEPRLTAMEGYLLTHPNIPYRRYRMPDELLSYDRLWVVSVTPSLFDLDVALAAAGWTPTYVELPEPLRLYLYRFDRAAGVGRPTAGT